MALVMCCKGLNYADAARGVEGVVGRALADTPIDKPDPRIALNRIRKLLRPVASPVVSYLTGRGLRAAPGLRQARLAYWHEGAKLGVFDAMVGKIVSATGKPESYHVTYLQDGQKAPVPVQRKVMTPVNGIAGGAIRLYAPGPTLGVAEGIETAIAAHMLADVPVWAAVSAHGIETFEPPATTERLLIFGDADENYTGQAAAFALAKRMKKRGLACEVRVPEAGDWNDALKRSAA
ncbi:MAG: toprim domain-containing protein [Pseudomonadota bacterium]|nr:toprim domain-containing protein [Pseudomonadota bacterium]